MPVVPAEQASVWLTGVPCRGGNGSPIVQGKDASPAVQNHPCRLSDEMCIGGDMLRVRTHPSSNRHRPDGHNGARRSWLPAVTPSPVSTRERSAADTAAGQSDGQSIQCSRLRALLSGAQYLPEKCKNTFRICALSTCREPDFAYPRLSSSRLHLRVISRPQASAAAGGPGHLANASRGGGPRRTSRPCTDRTGNSETSFRPALSFDAQLVRKVQEHFSGHAPNSSRTNCQDPDTAFGPISKRPRIPPVTGRRWQNYRSK